MIMSEAVSKSCVAHTRSVLFRCATYQSGFPEVVVTYIEVLAQLDLKHSTLQTEIVWTLDGPVTRGSSDA